MHHPKTTPQEIGIQQVEIRDKKSVILVSAQVILTQVFQGLHVETNACLGIFVNLLNYFAMCSSHIDLTTLKTKTTIYCFGSPKSLAKYLVHIIKY